MVILYIKRLSAILAFFFLFIGCAVSPELRDSLDPYEEQNRKVHEFNERVIENLIEPVNTFEYKIFDFENLVRLL